MSSESLRTAGVVLMLYPPVVFGGASLLWHWITRQTAYYDHPTRRSLWRAGHAHAGVLLLLSLIALRYVDETHLSDRARWLVRLAFPTAALLLPLAFFLSVLTPDATAPNPLVNLAYLGAALLVTAMLTLGVGLVRARSTSGSAITRQSSLMERSQ